MPTDPGALPPPPVPPANDPPPAPPAREITLEEWIAAGQACCGRDDAGAD